MLPWNPLGKNASLLSASTHHSFRLFYYYYRLAVSTNYVMIDPVHLCAFGMCQCISFYWPRRIKRSQNFMYVPESTCLCPSLPITEFSKLNLQKMKTINGLCCLCQQNFLYFDHCVMPQSVFFKYKKVRRGGCRREMFGQHGPSRQACLAKLAPGPAAVQCF